MRFYTAFNPEDFTFEILGKRSKKGPYCNDVFTLDSESTSCFIDKTGKAMSYEFGRKQEDYRKMEKIGIRYKYMLSVKGSVFYCDYGWQLRDMMCRIHKALGGARFTVYVQNLSWDFSYIINDIKIDDVFARKSRTPLKCRAPEYNAILKDSYCLNMMTLETTAKTYNLEHKKQVGKLDYNLLRLPCTPLTDAELKYCEYDCLALDDYINMKKKQYGDDIEAIPMTQTGEIRLLLKEEIKKDGNPRFALRNWYKKNKKDAPDYATFKMLVAAYAGGYTHANSKYVGMVLECLNSYDFASSYPAVLFLECYPTGQWYKTNERLCDIDVNRYAYLMTLKFTNIQTILWNTYISESKCDARTLDGKILDNGRIAKARSLTITITEQDWLTIQEAYKWKKVEVITMKKCPKKRLPRPLINLVVKLYKKKNILKKQYKAAAIKAEITKNPEDEAKAAQLNAELTFCKQQLNGIYGMCVTRFVSEPVTFGLDDEDAWDAISYLTKKERKALKDKIMTEEEAERIIEDRMEDQLEEHNERDLLPYQWGVWVSAYARRNLWSMIIACDEEVVYCDTDSIKCLGDVSDKVEDYNRVCRWKRKRACDFYGIEESDVDMLGEFDDDGQYEKFVTLGAKKYAVIKHVIDKKTEKEEDVLEITISGVNKKDGACVIKEDLSNFCIGTIFDDLHSGRKIRYYNDDQKPITLTDYLGNTETISDQKHGIILQPTTYKLGTESFYANYGQKAKLFENVEDFMEDWT